MGIALPNKSAFFVGRHETGVGYFLSIPSNEEFRLTRYFDPEVGEEVLVEGVFPSGQLYLDWGVNPRGATVYRYYLRDGDEYIQDSEWAAEPKPLLSWNPIDVGSFYAASDPRDALIVFLSARLAQLVRNGTIKVKNPNHGVYFPVKRNYMFELAETPVISARYSAGAGVAGDISGILTEEMLDVSLDVAAGTDQELDQVTRALRGLRGEVERFLTDLGCLNARYTNFSEFLIPNVEPQLYGANMTISCTAYTFLQREEETWTLLPSHYAKGIPDALGGGAVITTRENATLEALVQEADERIQLTIQTL